MLVLDANTSKSRFRIIRHIWFADSPSWKNSVEPSIYFHAHSLHGVLGFERRSRWTSLVDISRDDSALLSGFTKKTRYETRRADQDLDGVSFLIEDPLSTLSGDREASPGCMSTYESNAVISVAKMSSGHEIRHQYIQGRNTGRVHLYGSSSDFESMEGSLAKSRMARLNRLMHFRDMLYFRSKGYSVYDFGGIANAPSGSKLGNIDAFKLGFGGKLREESIYISLSIIGWNRFVRGVRTSV